MLQRSDAVAEETSVIDTLPDGVVDRVVLAVVLTEGEPLEVAISLIDVEVLTEKELSSD